MYQIKKILKNWDVAVAIVISELRNCKFWNTACVSFTEILIKIDFKTRIYIDFPMNRVAWFCTSLKDGLVSMKWVYIGNLQLVTRWKFIINIGVQFSG